MMALKSCFTQASGHTRHLKCFTIYSYQLQTVYVIHQTRQKKEEIQQSLPPTDELFLTLICLHVGLMEQDLPYRFNVSQSTVSRTIITGINFMYLELKKIPLWPPKEVVQVNMPKAFKEKYQRTRVIIDATEVYIDQ